MSLCKDIMNIGNVKYIRGNQSIEGQPILWPKENKDTTLYRSMNTKQQESYKKHVYPGDPDGQEVLLTLALLLQSYYC